LEPFGGVGVSEGFGESVGCVGSGVVAYVRGCEYAARATRGVAREEAARERAACERSMVVDIAMMVMVKVRVSRGGRG